MAAPFRRGVAWVPLDLRRRPQRGGATDARAFPGRRDHALGRRRRLVLNNRIELVEQFAGRLVPNVDEVVERGAGRLVHRGDGPAPWPGRVGMRLSGRFRTRGKLHAIGAELPAGSEDEPDDVAGPARGDFQDFGYDELLILAVDFTHFDDDPLGVFPDAHDSLLLGTADGWTALSHAGRRASQTQFRDGLLPPGQGGEA